MATNADTTVADDDKPVTSEDLRELKYGTDEVETSQEADETSEAEEPAENAEEASEEDGQTDDQATEETDETDTTESDSSEYVKEFPNIKGDTLEDYARGLEQAYKNSTTEALRLKGELDKPASAPAVTEETDVDISDPTALYVKQRMDEEITEAFSTFQKSYPQAVPGTPEYAQFVTEVGVLSNTILQSQKRLASPKELYAKAAVILGWEPDNKVDNKDKLGIALKGQAGSSKTTSTIKVAKKSKVSDQMLAANRLMYPNKTDAEIRAELEPYVK